MHGRPAGGGIEIRVAVRSDLQRLAEIHAQSLPQEFLVRLGPTFLRKVFFPTLLNSPHAHIYVAVVADAPVGFLITRVGMSGVLGEMLGRHPFRFAASCLSAVLRHPSLLVDGLSILAQLRMRAGFGGGGQTAELFLTAVDPGMRRKGIGSTLIEHSACVLEQAGVRSYRVLLHAANEPADRVYAAKGFEERTIHQFGRERWRERERRLEPPRLGG